MPADRSVARSLGTSLVAQEKIPERISSWSSRGLGGHLACSLLLRISIKYGSIDDNHERRTKAALGLEGGNTRAERRARRGAAQSRIRRSGPAGGGENNGGQRVV